MATASFFPELKRRGVFSAVAAYGVITAGALQMGDVISHALDLPGWVMKLMVVLSAVGLPVTAVVSWFYDLTRQGLVLTAPPPSKPSPRPAPGTPAAGTPPAGATVPATPAALASPASPAGSPPATPAAGAAAHAPAGPPLGPGAQLAGRYRLEGELGSGGMGRVLVATDEKLGRRVAVKLLSGAHDHTRLRRFEQEARAAGSLEHPNVLAVYDLGEHQQAPFLVTELLDGRTLRAVLAEGPLRPDTVREVGLQLARGLAAAHARGVVHRDLKPENLFLTKDGRLKILDFGLAKLVGDAAPAAGEGLTQQGTVFGTPGYLAPEQARGQPADTRSDVFAAGTVLYELLSGARAFPGATLIEACANLLCEEPAPLPRSVPAPLQAVVAKALEKEPSRRYQDGAGLAAALESLEAGGAGRLEVARAALPKAVSGRSMLLVAGGVCLALLFTGAVVSRATRRAHRAPERRVVVTPAPSPEPPEAPEAPEAPVPPAPPRAPRPVAPALPGQPPSAGSTGRAGTPPPPRGKQGSRGLEALQGLVIPPEAGVDGEQIRRSVAEALKEAGSEAGAGRAGGRIGILRGADSTQRVGRFDQSERLLRDAIGRDPEDVYFRLHLAALQRRQGRHELARTEIVAFVAQLDDEDWIAPLARFYAGSLSEKQVLAAAADEEDERQLASRLCEANYYLGVWYLTAGKPDLARARAFLTKAAESGTRDVEADFAREELTALDRR